MKAAWYEKQGAARDVLIIAKWTTHSRVRVRFGFVLLSQA